MNGVYFNEFDKFAASWLRNLFPESVVDERSIKDVGRADTAIYKRCHFFGGIGGWEYALQLAGWPDDRPVWTGSCPCQPFSAAGKQKGQEDERHLWPEMFRLIRECRPEVVFGEQVCSGPVVGKRDEKNEDLRSLQDREIVARVLCEFQGELEKNVCRMLGEGEGVQEEEPQVCGERIQGVENRKERVRLGECRQAPGEAEGDGVRPLLAGDPERDRQRCMSVDGSGFRPEFTEVVECTVSGQDRFESRIHEGQREGDSVLTECCGQHMGGEPCCADCECGSGNEKEFIQQFVRQDWKEIAGESVTSWVDGVFTDLESEGYTCGAVVLGAHSVGSPHIRQRLYWVAKSSSSRSQERDIGKPPIPESCEDIANGWMAQPDSNELQRIASTGEQSVHECGDRASWERVVFAADCDEDGNCPHCGVEYSECGCPGPTQDEEYEYCERGGVMLARRLGQSFQSRLEGHSGNGDGSHESRWLTSQEGRSASEAGSANFWSDFRIIHCTDRKARRTGRRVFPLVNGIPREMGRGQPELGKLVKGARNNRVGRLKGYGNAIVPQVAAEFIRAFLESEAEVMS